MKPIYYIAHCGDLAIRETGCMVAAEFFTDALAYGRRLKEIERLHRSGEVDSYTNGNVTKEIKT